MGRGAMTDMAYRHITSDQRGPENGFGKPLRHESAGRQ